MGGFDSSTFGFFFSLNVIFGRLLAGSGSGRKSVTRGMGIGAGIKSSGLSTTGGIGPSLIFNLGIGKDESTGSGFDKCFSGDGVRNFVVTKGTLDFSGCLLFFFFGGSRLTGGETSMFGFRQVGQNHSACLASESFSFTPTQSP